MDELEALQVGVPREERERTAGRNPAKLVRGALRERGRVHHHHVHASEQRPQPVAEVLLLLRSGPWLAQLAEVVARTALERVGVPRHAQAAHLTTTGP